MAIPVSIELSPQKTTQKTRPPVQPTRDIHAWWHYLQHDAQASWESLRSLNASAGVSPEKGSEFATLLHLAGVLRMRLRKPQGPGRPTLEVTLQKKPLSEVLATTTAEEPEAIEWLRIPVSAELLNSTQSILAKHCSTLSVTDPQLCAELVLTPLLGRTADVTLSILSAEEQQEEYLAKLVAEFLPPAMRNDDEVAS